MNSIFRSGRLVRGRRIFPLERMSWVFQCPDCEYAMSALALEGVQTIRRLHVGRCHPEQLIEVLWDDSPLSQV